MEGYLTRLKMQVNRRFQRGFKGVRTGARWASSQAVSAARRIQRVYRARTNRPRLRRIVRNVSLNTRPTDYYRPRIPTMQPSAGQPGAAPADGGLQLAELMTIPFSDDVSPGYRMGNKVFWKGLTIRWNITNIRPWMATETPGRVRFGLLEARGSSLGIGQVLYDPTNTGNINDTTTPFNHAKVRVLMEKTITIGDVDSWDKQGYRSTQNMKTFSKVNQMRMYEENNATTPIRPTRRSWYIFAIASGFVQQTIGPGITRQFVNIQPEVTFSFKDPA